MEKSRGEPIKSGKKRKRELENEIKVKKNELKWVKGKWKQSKDVTKEKGEEGWSSLLYSSGVQSNFNQHCNKLSSICNCKEGRGKVKVMSSLLFNCKLQLHPFSNECL